MMEPTLYKELAYKLRSFRVVSCLIAAVTVILCLLIGIGCWVLIAGVKENEKLLNAANQSKENAITIVEGEIREPLSLGQNSISNVGKIVEHIAAIDFKDGSPVDAEDEEIVAVAHIQHASNTMKDAPPPSNESPVPTNRIHHEAYKPSFSQSYVVVPENAKEVEIQEIISLPEGVVVVEETRQLNDNQFMRRLGEAFATDETDVAVNGPYGFNQLSVPQAHPSVVSTRHHSEAVEEPTSENESSLLNTFVEFTNDIATKILSQPRLELFRSLANSASDEYMERTFRMLGDYTSQMFGLEEAEDHRSTRSVNPSFIYNAVTYFSYGAFTKFLYSELSSIADYKLQSRKLSGDSEAAFLDQLFWPSAATTQKPSHIPSKNSETDKPVRQSTHISAYDSGWEPMVNQVSLDFIGEMLNTLLTMMKEFLLKDNVMECLWFMFCQDVNHQAKYSDIYGMMARVNSVGLTVLTERHDRSTDTISEIFRSLTAWTPLQCDVMFPKCDGTKALEIVNDVAGGSRK